MVDLFGTKRVHITWVGSYAKRVVRGITMINPDKIIFLIEAQSDNWRGFQMESLEAITGHFGQKYSEEEGSAETIEFPFLKSGEEANEVEFSKKLFHELYEVISRIRQEERKAEITIDVTASPKMVSYVMTFIMMVFSDDNFPIRMLYTPKAMEPLPDYYAPEGSQYAEKDAGQMSLTEYRTKEKDDAGKSPIVIELPRAHLELLGNDSERSRFLVSLFNHIPESEADPKKSSMLVSDLKEINRKVVDDLFKKDEEKKKKLKGDAREKALNTRVSLALQQFHDQGLIELSREGRYFWARRTWAGDLISLVVKDLYDERVLSRSRRGKTVKRTG